MPSGFVTFSVPPIRRIVLPETPQGPVFLFGRPRLAAVVPGDGAATGLLRPCVVRGHPGGLPTTRDLHGGDARARRDEVPSHPDPSGVTRQPLDSGGPTRRP